MKGWLNLITFLMSGTQHLKHWLCDGSQSEEEKEGKYAIFLLAIAHVPSHAPNASSAGKIPAMHPSTGQVQEGLTPCLEELT